MEIRVVVGGFVLRLFGKRADAINAANARTKLFESQHRELKFQTGYLVRNIVTGKLYDAAGEVPQAAADEVNR